MYRIYGRARADGYRVDVYGTFDNERDCMNHLDSLKRSCLGPLIKFEVMQVGCNPSSPYCEGCYHCVEFEKSEKWLCTVHHCNYFQGIVDPIKCEHRCFKREGVLVYEKD